ncbi:anaerobic C4-dicarboxylate transporter family protein [Vibrio sp. PP-XX7]
MCVILPAALFGCIVASFIASKQGCELSQDPIYQERVKQGLVNFSSLEENVQKRLRKQSCLFFFS